MSVESFTNNLDSFIKTSGSNERASKKSKIELPRVGVNIRTRFELGKMYNFRYFTSDEPEYDTNPIILFLGYNERRNLTGINLHYIPLKPRIGLIKDIIRSYNPIISKELARPKDPRTQRNLHTFIWDNVKLAYGTKYNVKHSVRQYRLNRIQKPLLIGYENWYLGVVNNENDFFGTTINHAQSLYYLNI